MVMVVALAIAVVLAVLFALQVTREPTARRIARVEFTQSEAVKNFDTSKVSVTDPAELQRFSALVHEYQVNLGQVDSNVVEGCAGGTSTDATLLFADGNTQKITLYPCGSGGNKFVEAASELFSEWRTSAGIGQASASVASLQIRSD
jgi:hypothetical protein